MNRSRLFSKKMKSSNILQTFTLPSALICVNPRSYLRLNIKLSLERTPGKEAKLLPTLVGEFAKQLEFGRYQLLVADKNELLLYHNLKVTNPLKKQD